MWIVLLINLRAAAPAADPGKKTLTSLSEATRKLVDKPPKALRRV
jgi:hypothetical protein